MGFLYVSACPRCGEVYRDTKTCPKCGVETKDWREVEGRIEPDINPLRLEIASYCFGFGRLLGYFGIFCLAMIVFTFFWNETQYIGFLVACALGSWILKPVFEAIADSICAAGLPKK